jgi:glycosyltransferase involved in cell wall biosynthesis
MIIIPTLGYGGAESLVINWIRDWLDSDRVSKVVLVLYSAKFSHRLGELATHPKFKLVVEDTVFPWKLLCLRYLPHLWRLRRIIRDEAPDVVHCHLAAGTDMALIFGYLRRVRLFVFTCHSLAEKECAKHYRGVRKRFFKARNVEPVAVSPTVERSFDAFYRLPCRMIWNGVPVGKTVGPAETMRQELLKMPADYNFDRKIFIAVGRVMKIKNYDMLTGVFRRLYDKKANVMLVVLGDFIEENERERYEAMKNKNIFFLGRKDNVPKYLAAADFYCTASVYEGCSIALAEAMSAKVVPIVTPVSGLTDIISGPQHGIVAGDMSEDAYEQAVLKALELSDADKERIVENNYALYRENLSMEVCSKRYLDLFEEYVKDRK